MQILSVLVFLIVTFPAAPADAYEFWLAARSETAPDGSHVFLALRGPNPLTGNYKTVNNAVGSTPGVGVVKVPCGGKGGELVGVARVSNMKDGKKTADPHTIALRK
jgi:hypothetical protein